MSELYLKALTEYGLTENQIKIYLAILKLGEATAQVIAKQASLPRTTTYHLLESLLQKGLVSFVEKDLIKQFQATPPEYLIELITEKKKLIETALPQLQALASIVKEKPKVIIYEGLSGIKNILQEILSEKREILHYGDIISLQEVLKFAFPNFIIQRIKRKIPIRIICKREEAHQALIKNAKTEYRSFVFIPKEYKFNTSVFLYSNKIAILSLHSEPYFGIIIKNEDYYQSERNMFELLWKAYSKN